MKPGASTEDGSPGASGGGGAPAPDGGRTPARGLRLRRIRITPLWVISIAVLLLLVFSQLFISSTFFSEATLSAITPLVGVMIIAATGQAFVIGTGGIDLSAPATITLMGTIVLQSSHAQNSQLAGALILCAVACVAIGIVNGVLVEAVGLNALVVTLAVGQLVQGVARLLTGPIITVTGVPSSLSRAALAELHGVSYLLIIAIGMALIATFYLHRIVHGRRLVASSAALRAAWLAGVRARPYRVFAFVIASLCYGVGGVLAAGQVGTPDLTLGDPYLLTPIVAVVLGGAVLTGGRISPLATLLGAVFVTILNFDLSVKGLSAGASEIVQGLVIVIGLTLVFLLRNLPTIRRTVRQWRSGAPSLTQTTGQ